MLISLISLICPIGLAFVHGAVLDNCSVAFHLQESDVSESLWNTWICLADALSQGNSSKLHKSPTLKNSPNDSGNCMEYSLGLFQIPNLWCTTEEHKDFGKCTINGCQLDCLKLLDDDIQDDIECMKTIAQMNRFKYEFTAWSKVSTAKCYPNSRLQPSPKNYGDCLMIDGRIRRPVRNDGLQLTSIPLWATVVIVAISCLIVFSLTYLYYKYRQNRISTLSATEIKQFKYGKIKFDRQSYAPHERIRMSELIQNNAVDEPYNTEYEVSQSKFFIDQNICLGSGAYGIVYKGSCKGRVVAVKTVKPNATKEYFQSLLGEIKILSYIGRHDFIVNLEGAFTKHLQQGIVYIFTEYCGLGNLEKFLRSNRNNFVNIEEDLTTDANSSYGDGDSSSTVPKTHCINLKFLLQYAHQIAKGMDFLSTKQVIHGDLAARNILLVDQNTAKISDFGLSRKLYGYINYIKKKEEPLPWRWMAIESLKEMNFSTSSDVWMYGVLLYEIFSLGEVPYPGLSWSLEFVDNLGKGFRMLQPKHAPLNVYTHVMLKCWENNPIDRPSFLELSNYFYEALHKITSKDYTCMIESLAIQQQNDANNPASGSSYQNVMT